MATKNSFLDKYAEIINMDNKEVEERFGVNKNNVLKVLKYFVKEELEFTEKVEERKPRRKSNTVKTDPSETI